MKTTTYNELESLLHVLYENEINSITAGFAGSCDSGEITDITGINIDDEEVPEKELAAILIRDYTPETPDDFGTWSGGKFHKRDFKEKPLAVTELFENIAYRELENRHGGWEINSGSSGDISITVPRKKDGTFDETAACHAKIDIDIEYGYDDEDEEYDGDEEYDDN